CRQRLQHLDMRAEVINDIWNVVADHCDGTEDYCSHVVEQSRLFGGMVGNLVGYIVNRYGTDSEVPKALTDYIKGREGYDYNEHGRAGNTHANFVPDEIVERFCLIGTAEEHEAKLRQLEAIGMTQFAGYLDHDNKEETLRVYGETVIPAFAEQILAKS